MTELFDEDKQRIALTVDAVVFTVRSNQLNVLLIKRKYPPFTGEYAFPGGFVRNDEELEDAAQRELTEETGIKKIFLRKLNAYGAVDRDPRKRIVSVAFMALIDAEEFRLQAATDALVAEWVPVATIKKLAFDHKTILEDAVNALRYEIQTTNIAAQLLPEKFTLSELQALYESVLGKELDKRNFRKRIKELNMLKETSEQKLEGAHRPARLYKFREQQYRQLREKIHIFV